MARKKKKDIEENSFFDFNEDMVPDFEQLNDAGLELGSLFDDDDEDEEEIDEARFKSSAEKTREEKIRTSRSKKIKHNNWNNVDYEEDIDTSRIVIDPDFQAHNTSFEFSAFEKDFQEVMEKSKYNHIFHENERVVIDYDVLNEMLYYFYGQLKSNYSMTYVFVALCEYCGLNIAIAWKKLSSYIQGMLLKELSEYSNLPKELLNGKDGSLF